MPIVKDSIKKNVAENVISTPNTKPKILLVDGSETNLTFLNELLSNNYEVAATTSGIEALELCLSFVPDIILMSIQLNDYDGIEACRYIKQSRYTNNVSVIMISASQSLDVERRCWQAGCVDYISKPYIKESLLHRVESHCKHKQMADKLRQLSMMDNVTNVFNRHYLEQYIYQNSVRSDTKSVSIFFIDIDYFKAYNDQYGHLAGDVCLKEVAKIIEKNLRRPSDFVVRYGGEEFAIILPSTSCEGAKTIANNLVEAISNANYPHLGSPLKKVTISLGGVTYKEPLLNWKDMLLKADAKLYEAKKAGRNLVKFEYIE